MQTLEELAKLPNITKYIEEDTLREMGDVALEGYNRDMESLASYLDSIIKVRKMMNAPENRKTFPWPDASNVRYPLITVAALQFNARSYSTIMGTSNVALAKVIGADPDGAKQGRADRVGAHMSWQLTEEMDEWDEDMDKLLLILPIDGCAFKKVFYDPTLGRNSSQLVMCDDLIVNMDTISLATCPRISQHLSYYPYEIQEKVNMDVFRDVDYRAITESNRTQEPSEFIEQHTYFDLDEDGYPEPYIITFEKDTGLVARVKANFTPESIIYNKNSNSVVRIEPTRYFVKYECLPDSDGGFYGRGFGHLMMSLNETADSILNQLIDAGTLSNTGGGFMARSFRVQSGSIEFIPGEWQKVDTGGLPMKDAIMPLPVKEPSNVLFSLLGLIIDAAKEVSSIQDVMTGGGGANTPATTVLAMIEQGMKVYTSIFKRIYRSLRQELILLYRLNARHLSPEDYARVMDDPAAIAREDYNTEDLNIAPAADPSMATDIQKAARAQVLLQYAQVMPDTMNRHMVTEEGLRTAGIPDATRFIMPPAQGPTPEQQVELMELQIKRQKAFVDTFTGLADALEKLAKTDEMGANNLLNLQELIVSMTELMKHEQGRHPNMEGREPMAVGPDPGAGGPAQTGVAGPMLDGSGM